VSVRVDSYPVASECSVCGSKHQSTIGRASADSALFSVAKRMPAHANNQIRVLVPSAAAAAQFRERLFLSPFSAGSAGVEQASRSASSGGRSNSICPDFVRAGRLYAKCHSSFHLANVGRDKRVSFAMGFLLERNLVKAECITLIEAVMSRAVLMIRDRRNPPVRLRPRYRFDGSRHELQAKQADFSSFIFLKPAVRLYRSSY